MIIIILPFFKPSHKYRVVQSFEIVAYLFAQQLELNETLNITLNSLTVITELVRQLVMLYFASYRILHNLYNSAE